MSPAEGNALAAVCVVWCATGGNSRESKNMVTHRIIGNVISNRVDFQFLSFQSTFL